MSKFSTYVIAAALVVALPLAFVGNASARVLPEAGVHTEAKGQGGEPGDFIQLAKKKEKNPSRLSRPGALPQGAMFKMGGQ